MEESQEILLNSLQNSGVSVPAEVSSIRDLTPTTLVSICAQSLNLIDRKASFPTSLPDSMAQQFKICSDMASAIQNLGFIGDMSFHKFLYPSEEDLYKLVRFFVERLSESSKDDKSAHSKDENARRKIKEGGDKSTSEEWIEEADNEEVDLYCQKVEDILNDLRLKTEVPKVSSIKTEDPFISELNKNHCIAQKIEVASGDLITSGSNFSNDEITSTESNKGQKKLGNLRNDAAENEADKNDNHISLLEQKVTSVSEQSSKKKFGIKTLRDQEKVLMEEVAAKNSEVQHLEIELQLWKEAASLTFDDQHPIDYYTERLNDQVDARKHSIEELEAKWDTFRKPLEEKRRSLEETLYSTIPGSQEKLQKLKQVDLEAHSILSEIRKRDEEYDKLTADLKKQPKVASRRSHIQRITEITKNSRKQEGDIEQILKETRELQLESNSIQERLHRSYAVLDEIVFREAKKDSVGRQAYRLLTSIHESFEQISEKILATDRIRREVAEHEKKLTTMAARSLNLDKLQADLHSIRQENEFLEEQQRQS